MKNVFIKFLLSITVFFICNSLLDLHALENDSDSLIYTDVINSIENRNNIEVYDENSENITEKYFAIMLPLDTNDEKSVINKFNSLNILCFVNNSVETADTSSASQKKCTIYGAYSSGIKYRVEVTVKYKYNDINGNLVAIYSWSSKYYSMTNGYTGEVLSADVKRAGTKSINIAISVQCKETRENDYTGDTFTV